MAIDFYDIRDASRKHRLFGIEQKDFELIYDAVAELQRRTGILIDQYGKTRLGGAHLEIVISAVQKILNDTQDISIKKRIEEILLALSSSTDGYLILGD
ncbi:hypothetical protein [Mucilaginibacter flavidus]|uniref:hypothetical protein n=1 Tax=Mucilaginibacter flavidus TaxID=2949309 RepID=UPI00209338C6|nr:hypothetical protein [Mucilaginibacter flavidus]MCO5950831.1 hypothetical protein [Mucilaginibacter flavidus]